MKPYFFLIFVLVLLFGCSSNENSRDEIQNKIKYEKYILYNVEKCPYCFHDIMPKLKSLKETYSLPVIAVTGKNDSFKSLKLLLAKENVDSIYVEKDSYFELMDNLYLEFKLVEK
jgi:hypothetical protein